MIKLVYVECTTVCLEYEPPLFSSALNSNEDFIEKRCGQYSVNLF